MKIIEKLEKIKEDRDKNGKFINELCIDLDLSPFATIVLPDIIIDGPKIFDSDFIKTSLLKRVEPKIVDEIYDSVVKELLKEDCIEYDGSSKARFTVTDNFKEVVTDRFSPDKRISKLSLLDSFIKLSEYVDTIQIPGNKYVDIDVYVKKIFTILYTINQDYKVTKILDWDIVDDFESTNTTFNASFLIFLTTLCDYVVHKKKTIKMDEFNNLFRNRAEFKKFIVSFRFHKNILFRYDFLKDSEKNDHEYELTEKSKKLFLSDILELEKEAKHDKHSNSLILPKNIKKKKLYFDSEISDRLSDLYSFFDKNKYDEIISGLVEQGFKPGFTCLFYGSPGTGKTETVYQIARETGREIMFVDIASMRDKYVGESEKNLKEIFVSYRELLLNSDKEPILLFNEADSLFGTRTESTRSSVDKMENAMQNILLQELENFEGILIATTNLQGNLDKAFERRFLYKLKFTVPSIDIRKKIWRSKIKGLNDKLAYKLASSYNFSGGQIDNIAKKYIIGKILKGDSKSSLERYCEEETITKREKIGF